MEKPGVSVDFLEACLVSGLVVVDSLVDDWAKGQAASAFEEDSVTLIRIRRDEC